MFGEILVEILHILKKKIFVLPCDTSPKLVCIDMLFHKIKGNGGARGASHIVILFTLKA